MKEPSKPSPVIGERSAEEILKPYETYVSHSGIPIFLRENVLKAMEEYAYQFKEDNKAFGEWISVKDRPLFTKDEKGRWTVTKDGDREFIAAVPYYENGKGDSWWIRHCVVEDQIGLCVVGDDYNEPAGWHLEDVEFWMPLPSPPCKPE